MNWLWLLLLLAPTIVSNRFSWKRFRYVIPLDGQNYLVRYRLISTPWRGYYLHHILRSDKDRYLHDHPWDFTSLILFRGYVEYSPGSDPPAHGIFKARWLGMGSIVRHKAEDLHRLELPNGPVWTLVTCGPRVRKWGFLTEFGWIDEIPYHKALKERAEMSAVIRQHAVPVETVYS